MKLIKKIVLILIFSLFVFSLYGCEEPDDNLNPPVNPPIQEPENKPETEKPGSMKELSYNAEGYIGDLETFVYGLLISKLEYLYDVFPAYVQLSDSCFVYGLGYTDYTECYTNEDESIAYFLSGFLPFVGELDVPEDDFNNGLYLSNLDFEDENTKFIWTYRSDAFLEHCVVYGMYLQYGVSEQGKITYSAVPFEREKCDVSLGSLYSYDDSRYLYDVDFGEYVPVTGISITETIDYELFEAEINAFIEEQEKNWIQYDVTTIAYNSKEAVKSYLLSLQQDTFLGYPVDQLIEAVNDLNPLECFRVTPEGLMVVDIDEKIPEGCSNVTKWLVGTSCVIAAGVGIVASMVTAACPPLSALAGAVTGAAIEIFMQVVIESKNLDDVSWVKVAVAAGCGAVSGFIGPYLQCLNAASYFIVDSLVDGMVGGIEQAIFAWMDGGTSQDILSSFGYGFALGAAMSAGFKVLGKVVSKASELIGDAVKKIAEKLPEKLTKTVSKFTKPLTNIGNAIGDGFNKLKQKVDSSVFHSKYISKKMLYKTISNLTEAELDELFDASVGKGVLKADRIVDLNGNNYDLNRLKYVWKNAQDGQIIGYVDSLGTQIPVIVKNKAIGIYGADLYQSVKLKDKSYAKYDNIREENLTEAVELFRKKWIENVDEIPESVYKEIAKKYPELTIEEALRETMSTPQLKTLINKAGFSLHEELEFGVVTLMPTDIHRNIGHVGGNFLEKWLKQHMGSVHFETFMAAAANGFVIGGVTDGEED